MATLVIRGLDDEVKARLRVHAAEHGRSMEAEARALVAAALSGRRPSRGLGSHIRDQFADLGERTSIFLPGMSRRVRELLGLSWSPRGETAGSGCT